MNRVYARTLEATLGFGLVLWGLWLLAPWDTFSTSPSFNAFAAVASETAWGATIAAVGAVRAAAAVAGGRRARLWTAVPAAVVWVALAGLFAVANPQGTGVPIYTTLAVASLVSVVFTFAEARQPPPTP